MVEIERGSIYDIIPEQRTKTPWKQNENRTDMSI